MLGQAILDPMRKVKPACPILNAILLTLVVMGSINPCLAFKVVDTLVVLGVVIS
jgi:hypothetical protein